MFKKIYYSLTSIFLDIIAIAFTYILSLFILRQFDIVYDVLAIFRVVLYVIALKIAIFYIFRVYDVIPKYTGFEDLLGVMLISFASNIFIVALMSFDANNALNFVSRTAFFIIAPTEVFFLSIPRVIYRIINYFETSNKWFNAIGKRTLIIGGGQAAELVIKEIFKNKSLNLLPIGILDDDEKKLGSRISGIKIIGKIEAFRELVEKYNISDAVIAINDYPYNKLQALYEQVKDLDIKIQRLIGLSEVNDEPVIKDLRIEDLLNRHVITLDNSGIEDIINDEIVLVTGGGGSIGSELVRQIAHYRPKKLIIFDIYENNAYDIQMDLLRMYQKREEEIPFELHVHIGSVYNLERVNSIFDTYKPTIVFHAAAYKHVPLMEENYVEAIRTNVIGTYYMIKKADEYKAKRFIMISTDKAVRSTNIMGASKRLAEKIMQSYDTKSNLLMSAVRFGNVLNSNGSVIPLFMKQIKDGGPINVTHKDITRYFMTIPEAVSLILQSTIYMNGRDVFVLDMGEPVKIYDLAENMIRLMGLRPYEDIDIHISGLRPGEKLYEELLLNNEFIKKTANGRIFVEEKPFEPITFDVSELPNDANVSKKEVVDFLKKKVTSYNPKNV